MKALMKALWTIWIIFSFVMITPIIAVFAIIRFAEMAQERRMLPMVR
jgi:hypothetical protein